MTPPLSLHSSSRCVQYVLRSLSCLLVLVCLLVLPAGNPVFAQTDGNAPDGSAVEKANEEPQIVSLRLGFNGQYKVGCWTQAEVQIVGGTAAENGAAVTGLVSITVPDTDGVPATFYSSPDRPVGVASGRITTARLIVRSGQSDANLSVKLLGPGGKVLTKRKFRTGYPDEFDGGYEGSNVLERGLSATDRLLVHFGPEIGLARVARRVSKHQGSEEATRAARVTNAADLPLDWYGYEGVDTMVLSTSDPKIYRSLSGDSARLAALEEWVKLGGRLVLFCGQSAEELLASDGPLSRFAPGTFAQMVPLRDSLPIELFANTQEKVNRGRIDLRVPQLTDVRGKVLAQIGEESQGVPLAVRTRRGLGIITFVSLDPDVAPLAKWEGRSGLLRAALDWPLKELNPTEDNSTYGYNPDLTAQLRGGLDHEFSGVVPVSFGIVALLVLLYILLIGPGDYFFVKRILKRMELTWLTFPLIVAGVSLAAYWLAHRLKGDDLRVNQVEIVDIDTSTNQARGTVLTHFFSPRVKNYSLSLHPQLGTDALSKDSGQDSSRTEVLTAWLGLPGVGLGGMQSGAAQPTLFDRGYQFSPQHNAIHGVPVQEWSTKTITARWQSEVPELLQATLTSDEDQRLQGELSNLTTGPFTEVLLLHNQSAYPLPTISAGETVQLDRSIKQRPAKGVLTSESFSGQNAAQANNTMYDAYSTDVGRVAKTMMFYQAAGGREYTNTPHRYQHFLDLSHLLESDQAILMVRVSNVDESGLEDAALLGSQWYDEDQPLASNRDLRWTYYRFVIRVKQQQRLGP